MDRMSASVKTYRESLPLDVRKRYDEKIAVIGVDPYEVPLSDFSKEREHWPYINLVDVTHYLVYQQSAYTKDQLRNFKALEAFKLFQDGWIRETFHKEANGHHVLRSKVTHSMAVRSKLLDAWVVVGADGNILSGHCTCMAGLGECCSHVAAILFSLETWGRIKQEASVTDAPAYWMFPAPARFDAPYKRICEIDYTSAVKKRTSQPPVGKTEDRVSPDMGNIPSPTKAEEESFMLGLHSALPTAGILSVQRDYHENFVPKALHKNWPINFSTIHDKNCDNLEYKDILLKCKQIDISVTEKEKQFTEEHTRGQANSSFWHKYRCGRVTASKLHAVTHTNQKTPSMSLLKSICHADQKELRCPAVEWGRKKEGKAKQLYFHGMREHENFTVKECGLMLNPRHPEFAASPDGIVNCDCCGKGCLEIKCPFTAKDKGISGLSWLTTGKDGKRRLARDHPYFFQVQMQMHMSECKYCDFYVWSPVNTHQERIERDEAFWSEFSEVAKAFHSNCIMPELLSSYFSKKRALTAVATSENSTKASGERADNNEKVQKCCVCGGEDDGSMIECEGENCCTKWFHIVCLKLKKIPKGKWLCSQCKS